MNEAQEGPRNSERQKKRKKDRADEEERLAQAAAASCVSQGASAILSGAASLLGIGQHSSRLSTAQIQAVKDVISATYLSLGNFSPEMKQRLVGAHWGLGLVRILSCGLLLLCSLCTGAQKELFMLWRLVYLASCEQSKACVVFARRLLSCSALLTARGCHRRVGTAAGGPAGLSACVSEG